MTYGRLVESKSALRQEVRCQWQRAQQTCLLRMAAKTRRLNWPTLERGLRLPEQIQKLGSTASPGTSASNQQAAPCVQSFNQAPLRISPRRDTTLKHCGRSATLRAQPCLAPRYARPNHPKPAEHASSPLRARPRPAPPCRRPRPLPRPRPLRAPGPSPRGPPPPPPAGRRNTETETCHRRHRRCHRRGSSPPGPNRRDGEAARRRQPRLHQPAPRLRLHGRRVSLPRGARARARRLLTRECAARRAHPQRCARA